MPISANVSSFGYGAAVAAADAVDSNCVRSSNAARVDDDDDDDVALSLGSRTGGDDVRGRSLRDITLKRLAVVVVGGVLLSSEDDNIDDDATSGGATDAAAGGGVGAGRLLPLEKPNDVRSTMAFFVGVVLPPLALLALLVLEVTMVDGLICVKITRILYLCMYVYTRHDHDEREDGQTSSAAIGGND